MTGLTRRATLAAPFAPLLAPLARFLPRARKLPDSIIGAWHYMPTFTGSSMTTLRPVSSEVWLPLYRMDGAILRLTAATGWYAYRGSAWMLIKGSEVAALVAKGRPVVQAMTKVNAQLPKSLSEKAVWNALKAAKQGR